MKVTLSMQIAEIERELNMREQVYPRWVESRRMSDHGAKMKMRDMRAALATLCWLRDNEELFRSIATQAAILKAHPSVQAVMAAFPDAQLMAARDAQPDMLEGV